MSFKRKKKDRHRIRIKMMTRDLDLKYLGVTAKFYNIKTSETYYSNKYKVILAIFRNFNCPILIKDAFHNCWTHSIDDGETSFHLSERYVRNFKTKETILKEIENRKK
jgi:hypothetical protein